MDLSRFDTKKAADEGFRLQLKDPLGQPTDIVIVVKGADSEQFQAAKVEALRRQAEQPKKRGVDYERIEAELIDLLVAVTVAWENVQLDGEALACTQDNARKLYRRFPWIREQVDAAIYDRANFIPGSGKP